MASVNDKVILGLYGIAGLIFGCLLQLFFGMDRWIIMLSWCNVAIIALGVFALFMIFEEKLFWAKKTKNIRNKHVVVTGGSSGIGKCIAILAAKQGANVTIIARDVQKLERAKHEILQACENKDTQRVEYLSLDIGGNYETVEKELTDLENFMGPIYMLVNCAGLAIGSKIEDTTMENLDKMMRTNFLGTYYCIKAVVPKMKAAKEGMIVLVSSQAGLLGIFGYSAYCSTKFALRGLAESLAMELRPYNISVTLSLPPDTDTPGFAIEELSKPMETKAISEMAKLMKPEIVAEKILKDTLASNFFSTVGLEGFILTTLCAGMSPIKLIRQLFMQVCLMGPMRLVGAAYLFFFHRVIDKLQGHA